MCAQTSLFSNCDVSAVEPLLMVLPSRPSSSSLFNDESAQSGIYLSSEVVGFPNPIPNVMRRMRRIQNVLPESS